MYCLAKYIIYMIDFDLTVDFECNTRQIICYRRHRNPIRGDRQHIEVDIHFRSAPDQYSCMMASIDVAIKCFFF